MPHPSTPSVCLLVDTSSGWGRRLLRGVLSYAEKHGPWDIWLEPRGQREAHRLPPEWDGHGVIARVSTLAMAQHLADAKVPTVNVSSIRLPSQSFPRVSTDNVALAQMVLEHFLDRGVRACGYVGLPDQAYSRDRLVAFNQACVDAGVECHQFSSRSRRRAGGMSRRDALTAWLRTLPRPVGVHTWGVWHGVETIKAANRASLRVPDEVAIVGGDDDELLCHAVNPSLSGVMVPSEQIGHEAAALLDRMMKGERVSNTPQLLSPTGVTSRASTDLLAIQDEEVVAAIRYIRDHCHEPLRVSEVADALTVARRSLERRFLKTMRRTVGQEIARVHLERAKSLLARTDLPIPHVADASGYGSPEYMATIFKKAEGCTPLRYRMRVQGR